MSEYIVANPAVLGGKPCIKGTRISIDHLLELFASGATREDILSAHPHLDGQAIDEALLFAARILRGEQVWDIKIPA